MSQGELMSLISSIGMQQQFYNDEIKDLKRQIKLEEYKQKENNDRVQTSKQLPMLVATVNEMLPNFKDEETGENYDGCIISTTQRQEVFCPSKGLLANDDSVKPNSLVAVNRDTFLLYQSLSQFYDNRVKKMEIDEKPKDTFADLGGIDNIIKEVEESIILPLEKPELFKEIGIKPSKNILLYSEPGLGKTSLARALANRCNAIFLSVCATELIQMYIGEGSMLLTDLFKLASDKLQQYDKQIEELKEKAKTANTNDINEQIAKIPRAAIIYIDEIDAIGGRRSDDENKSNKEIGRTLMTLLNLIDGFSSDNRIKVIASTNRVNSLDPALVRNNRFDKKIEIKSPDAKGREKILQIHSKNMKISELVNYSDLSKLTDGMSGAQLRQVCIEAAMQCMRRNGKEVNMQDFTFGIQIVLNLNIEDKIKNKNIV